MRPADPQSGPGSALGSGNRCGHDPEAPRAFVSPAEHRPRPGVLRKLIERVHGYFDHPARLPSLNAANGKARQQRSERREACILLLSSLIHYLDLTTLRVGIPCGDGSFIGLTMDKLAEVAGLGLRRAERSLHDLVAAGILTVFPISTQIAPGEFVGRAAIRVIPSALFGTFGLGERLKRERAKASKRRREEEPKKPPSPTAQARIRLALNAVRGKLGLHPTPPAPASTVLLEPAPQPSQDAITGAVTAALSIPVEPSEPPQVTDARRKAQIIVELHRQHPEASLEQLLALYQHQLE
jgi:hypothetical protein